MEENKEEIVQENAEKETDCGCGNCSCEGENAEVTVDETAEKIKALEEEAAKWKDGYVRKVAEFDNMRKRMERDKEEFQKYSNEKILLKVLEVVDNLERAVASSKSTKDFDSLVKGVEMTLNHFHNVFQVEGLAVLEAKGKEFNPYEHHAILHEESEEHEDNVVMEELQRGYKLKERVIRPSLVKVAKKKK